MRRWNVGLALITVSLTAAVVACGSSGSSSSAPAANTPPPASNPSYVNPQVALDGMGRWQTVGDQNYFIPNAQPDPQTGEAWAPYQNGSWAYDQDQNWSWDSDDTWGDVTDHYGIWRHHQSYGWIWLPFQDMHYAPHTVTWFDDGDYIGWYPYDADYADSYRRYGQNYGFNDGYWQGEQAALQVNLPGFNLFLGFTVVNRTQATEPHLRQYLVEDRNVVFGTVYRAHLGDGLRRVGRYPGGNRDLSYGFLQSYDTHTKAPVGRAERVKTANGNLIIRPPRATAGRPDPNQDNRDHRDHTRGGGVRPAVQPPRPDAQRTVVQRPPDPKPTVDSKQRDRKHDGDQRPGIQPAVVQQPAIPKPALDPKPDDRKRDVHRPVVQEKPVVKAEPQQQPAVQPPKADPQPQQRRDRKNGDQRPAVSQPVGATPAPAAAADSKRGRQQREGDASADAKPDAKPDAAKADANDKGKRNEEGRVRVPGQRVRRS